MSGPTQTRKSGEAQTFVCASSNLAGRTKTFEERFMEALKASVVAQEGNARELLKKWTKKTEAWVNGKPAVC